MKTNRAIERMEVQPESLYYHEHVARYRFAGAYLRPGLTLDIACGSGYGTSLLSGHSDVQVLGADIHFPTLLKARRDYPDPQVGFVTANGVNLPFCDNVFHNVVTLETLAHIADDLGYLREICRTLRPDGVCILSTPDRVYFLQHSIVYPYHVREYSQKELLGLLRTFFTEVYLFYQGFSARYHRQAEDYAASIQARKKALNPVLQFVIDNLYRPIKRLIPAGVANFFIRRFLGLVHPQPDVTDIAISSEPLEESSGFVAVCQQPLCAREH